MIKMIDDDGDEEEEEEEDDGENKMDEVKAKDY